MILIMLTCTYLLLFACSSIIIMSYNAGRNNVAVMLMLQDASFYGYFFDSLDQSLD